MKITDFHKFLFGTLRGRLILSLVLVQSVMMLVFILDLTRRQGTMLLDRQEEEAIALSQSLSTSAAGWLVSDDVAGLQELVENQKHYPELIFAILTDQDGQILAHTDKTRNGQFLVDLPANALLTVISRTPKLVDVAAPAILDGRLVGWVRVGIGQEFAGKRLAAITRNGIYYGILAILISSFIAWLMGLNITKRLYLVRNTMKEVSAGNQSARSRIKGTDEAAQLASHFNSMLDTLSERNTELRESQEIIEGIINTIPVRVFWKDRNLNFLGCNRSFARDAGFSDPKDIIGKNDYQMGWHEQADLYRSDDQQVITSGHPKLNIEEPQTTPEGKTITLLTSKVPLRNDQGEINGVLGTYMDITIHKQAEAKIQGQARLLELIFQHSQDCIVLLDKDYNFIRVSESYAKACSRNVTEFQGLNHFQLYPGDLREEFDKAIRNHHIYNKSSRSFTFPDHPEWGPTYWDLGMVPIRAEDGKVELILFTLKVRWSSLAEQV